MKKIYNCLLLIIFIAILAVIAMIIIKYNENYQNEKEVAKTIEIINQTEIGEETEEVEMEYEGEKVVGIIKIPKIDLEYPILEKTTNDTMELSVTKFWGNGVNQIGNLSIAGHNNYDGTMFGKTKKLVIGDKFELIDMKKVKKQYEVYRIYITDSNDISVIEVDEFGTREVTLITCSNGNKERLIVKAREI